MPRARKPQAGKIQPNCERRVWVKLAGATGLEPATSGVTGRHSNQLSYAPAGERQ
jgi:hypothetical protein